MTDPKQPPVTTVLLDAVCETVGIYRRESADAVDYDFDWFTSPLTRSSAALTHTSQQPLLKTLAALFPATPAPKQVDGMLTAPALPCTFRIHPSVPLVIAARALGPAYKYPVKGVPKDFQPIGLDLIAFLPRGASLDPAQKKPPTLLARACLARVVTGSKVAELEAPVELGVELRLAHKPPPSPPPASPPFMTAIAVDLGIANTSADTPRLRISLTDASYLSAPSDKEQAAVRSATWSPGQSPALPLIHTALLVLRAWVVWLCETHKLPPPQGESPHFAWRLRNHLFPLLEGTSHPGADGKPVVDIPAFPLAACTPDLPLLKPWLAAFLNPSVLITTLFHLRALLTGKESLGTASGSAIAWLSDRPGADDSAVAAAHAAPKPRDFGLVVRTTGDVARGSLALGLRGQQTWTILGGAARIGLALEGDLARADWDGMLAVGVQGVSASAKAKVQTGRAALFIVIEAAANAPLCTTSLGALARLEFGAEFSLSGIHAEVRATATSNGKSVVHSLAQAAADELAARKAQLKTAVHDLAADLGAELPADVKATVLAVIDDPADTAPLLARLIAWARQQAGSLAGALDLDLGLATLHLDADVAANSYAATLTPNLGAFPADLPVRLAPGTSVALTPAGVTLKTGLALALATDLPFTPSLVCTVGGGAPVFAVELVPTGTTTPIRFSLLGGPAPTAELIRHIVRPLLDRATRELTLIKNATVAENITVADLLDLLGIKSSDGQAWKVPDPVDVARALLNRLGPALGALAQNQAASLGLSLDFTRLGVAARNIEIADGNVGAKIGKLGVTLLAGDSFAPTLTLDALELAIAGSDGAPMFATDLVSVGKLNAKTSLTLAPTPELQSVDLVIQDVRLPLGSSGNGDAGLLSTGKDNPGLDIELGWLAPSGFYARFAGQAPKLSLTIDRVIGPIDVRRLNASLVTRAPATVPDLDLTLDAEFKLGGVRIAPLGLGVSIPLPQLGHPDKWKPTLDGLALAYREGGVAIAGMLARTDDGFVGQATVEAFGFQLGAAAAYSKIAPDGVASLALFGVLRATLGGPPFFVVTGVAAGFGVNRSFERPKRVADLKSNVLLATMQGAPTTMEQFRSGLPARPGAYWLAGGVKFVSYGFIRGDALLYVLFDHGFELGLIALASLEIPSLAQVNLAIEAGLSTRGEPTLFARASLYDSWLLHKDCQLTGGFALQVWPDKGDAVISLGGYHPAFTRPAHYPEVERIGFRWSLASAISIKGSCYFAMTPREAMGGGRLEVEGRWGPLAAGFHAAVDGLICWDPFWFDVNIQVGVWAAIDTFFGTLRLSLGVGLHVWGPPVGGVASIDIAVISISIPFGAETTPTRAPLPVASVFAEHLKIDLPAGTDRKAGSVSWPAQDLLAAAATAPLRLAVVSGRCAGDSPTLRLEPEFVLRLDTALPITELVVNDAKAIEFLPRYPPPAPPPPPAPAPPPPPPPIYLTLADLALDCSRLTIHTPGARGTLTAAAPCERPLALFGDPEAAAGTSSAMTRPLIMAVLWDMSAKPVGSFVVDQLAPEYADPPEWCPLPLTNVAASQAMARYNPPTYRAGSPWALAELQAVAPALAARLKAAGKPMPRRVIPQANFSAIRPAHLYRNKVAYPRRAALAPHAVERPPQLLELAYLTLPPGIAAAWRRTRANPQFAGLPRVSPPAGVPRSPLLAGVELHLVTPKTHAPATASPAAPAPHRTLRGKHPRTVRAPEGPARRSWLILEPHAFSRPAERDEHSSPALRSGELCVLDLARPDARRTHAWRLVGDSDQRLRLVALDPLGRPLADLELAPGRLDLSVPPGARRLALFGHGADAPQFAWTKHREPVRIAADLGPVSRGAGFTATTPLIAVGPRTLLAPGCVVRVTAGHTDARTPLCLAAAATLLRTSSALLVTFASPGPGVLGLHLRGDPRRLRALTLAADGERLIPGSARVRGDQISLAHAASPRATSFTLELPPGLALVGLTRWPDRSELPPDRPIDHPVSPHRAGTRFNLEVVS